MGNKVYESKIDNIINFQLGVAKYAITVNKDNMKYL